MRVCKRIPPWTKPCRRIPARIPNPLPKTASNPIPTEAGCLFFDLRAKASPPPAEKDALPPLLPNPIGRMVERWETEKMRKLRTDNKEKWTITALSKTFSVSRSFVIKNVLTKEEQQQTDEELIERIDSLGFIEKRGWLTKYKIREHRRNICLAFWMSSGERHFSVYEHICPAQLFNGINQDDFYRYRRYCSTKIRSIRHKYLKKTHTRNDKKAYAPPKITLSPKDKCESHLWETERDWTFAMALRKEQVDQPRKTFHARKKWNRAEKHATQLLEQLKEGSEYDTKCIQEAQNYGLWIKANRCFEYKLWTKARTCFEKCSDFFATRKFNDNKVQSLFDKNKETAALMIRYCNHMISRSGVEELDATKNVSKDHHMDIDAIENQKESKQDCKVPGFTPKELDEYFNLNEKKRQAESDLSTTFKTNASASMKTLLGIREACDEIKLLLETLQAPSSLKQVIKKNSINQLAITAKKALKRVEKVSNQLSNDSLTPLKATLKYISAYFGAVSQILHGKSLTVSMDLPASVDFIGTGLFNIELTGIAKFEKKWKTDLDNITLAWKAIKDDGYEMTRFGLQKTKQTATFLETLDELYIFEKGSLEKAILNKDQIQEFIPMKPIFYDLAYDLLPSPTDYLQQAK